MEESLDYGFVPDEDKEFEFNMMLITDEDWLVPDEILEYVQDKEYRNYHKSFSEEYNSEGE